MKKTIASSGLLNLSKSNIYAFLLFPFFLTAIIGILLISSKTREFALMLLEENSLFENLTFIFLMAGFIIGIMLFVSLKKENTLKLERIFLLFFSLGLFLIAMEEIAWGQQFFKFETPEPFLKYNAQGELTLHNVNNLQGKSEYFRIFFGLIGILGLYLNRIKSIKIIAIPYVLASFIAVILVISIFDLYDDYFPIHKAITIGTQRLSELMEMLIGLVSLLYLILLKRKLNQSNF